MASGFLQMDDDPYPELFVVADAVMESATNPKLVGSNYLLDNGPEGLTQADNDWLYGLEGISTVRAALRSRGVVAWWSAGPDRSFEARLRQAGFKVEARQVRAHGKRGARHLIWLCTT